MQQRSYLATTDSAHFPCDNCGADLDIFSISFFVKCTADDGGDIILPDEVKSSEIGINLIGECLSCGELSVASISIEQLSQLIKAAIRHNQKIGFGEDVCDQQEVAPHTITDIPERYLRGANMSTEMQYVTARTIIENFLNGKYINIIPCLKPSQK